jgi:uncharacterized protein (TIGR02145 family)
MIRNITILLLLSLSYSQPATEWTQVNIPSNQNIVKLISDGNDLYGATSTASIYFSSDNGLNWESLPLHPDIFPYGVDLFDKVDDYLFFSQNIGGSTYNYRTYYNEGNWEDWEILPYDESIIYEFVHYDNTIYALLNQGISVSSDYGTSWELIDTPSIIGYIHLQYVDDQYLYVNHGCILYRYNIETFEWVDITGILDEIGPPEPYSCTSIHQIEKFNDKLLISMYWYGGVGTLFYSQNNGDSWEIINSLPSLSSSGYGTNNVSAVATKNGILYAGTATSEDGIYYTQNLIDWTDYSAGLSNYNLSVSALTVTEENIYKLGGSVNLFQNELIGVCDDGYTEYDGECYYDEDLNFLTLLIYMNEIEFELHYDIGLTIWQNGRINTLLLEGMAIHEIPNNIQNLDSLVHLSFSDNELEFLPDEIGNLPSLNALFLSNNILVEIPETIGNLDNLEFFHMPGNQLTELPLSISNLSSLTSFNIDNNYLTTFPSSLLELNNLKYVYIANNAINILPTNINMMSSIQILSAYSNNISILPSSVGELSNLYHFDFANNDLTTIPETICNIYDNLTVFDIGLNDICPPYPECLTEEDVEYQDTSNCGEQPLCDEGYTEIDGECYYQSDLDVLQDFIDLNQSLNGEEPLEIGDQEWYNKRLTYLGLGNRSLTTIPNNIGNLNHIEYLFLSSNQFSILPESIGNLSSLKFLFLSYNQFTVLPNTIGELSSLESLYLHSNQLTILPETICNLPENSYIYFDNNQLCPPYPECLSGNGWLLGYQDTSECEPECDLGDINCDGDLNVLDVVLMVNMILEDEYDEIADINEDGVLNVLDVVIVVNLILDNIPNDTVTDIDGNIYETVQIGDQLWMAENLKVTHYQNSDEIPYIYNDPQYGAYINYSNNTDNVGVYGRLYNWFAVNDERGLCPDNWHVPSDDEFKSLEMYLGMSESETNGEGLRGTDEGGKLKEEGNEHWNSPNTGATNETDFTALPGGNRRYETYTNQEIFSGLNRYGFFWSSSEVYTVNAWYRVFSFDYSESNRYHLSKTNAFSIRCVED